MSWGKVLLTSASAGVKFHSNVRVLDAKTGKLKRIESPKGEILVDYGDKSQSGGKR